LPSWDFWSVRLALNRLRGLSRIEDVINLDILAQKGRRKNNEMRYAVREACSPMPKNMALVPEVGQLQKGDLCPVSFRLTWEADISGRELTPGLLVAAAASVEQGARRPAPPQAKQMGMHTCSRKILHVPGCILQAAFKTPPLTSRFPMSIRLYRWRPELLHPHNATQCKIGANRSTNGSTKLDGGV